MLEQHKHGSFIDRAMERRNNYKAIGEAIIASQQIGSVQACYALLNLRLVKPSRQIHAMNTLIRSAMTQPIISKESELKELYANNAQASAIATYGINSHFGKRNAYAAFVKWNLSKFNKCEVSYFSLYTTYYVRNWRDTDAKRIDKLKTPLVIDKKTGKQYYLYN